LGPAIPRHVLEYVVARTAISLRRGGAAAREAWFGHAPGGASREYERVLRCPVRFRQLETGLVLRADDPERPLRTASPEAAAARAGALARVQPGDGPSPSARLAAAVEDTLARGVPVDRETLARSLGMSGRTLARRLAGEQRTFRHVVDGARRTLAQRLVVDGTLDLGAVATRVGFSDLAAFGKAFRRWFGEAPSVYRARCSPEPPVWQAREGIERAQVPATRGERRLEKGPRVRPGGCRPTARGRGPIRLRRSARDQKDERQLVHWCRASVSTSSRSATHWDDSLPRCRMPTTRWSAFLSIRMPCDTSRWP